MFSIFPDPGANKERDYLEPQYAEALYPDYLEAADPQANSVLEIPTQPRTPAYLPQDVGSKYRGQGWIQIAANQSGKANYGTYAEEQPASHSVTSAVGLPGMTDPLEFGWATPAMIHSGWAPEGRQGRLGYSVKFIGMDALVRTLRVRQNETGARGPAINPAIPISRRFTIDQFTPDQFTLIWSRFPG